ncbi:hypothetical protein AB6A40_005046 [Gnathostoma spinigerum]|uniref:SH3 domain-containing protein n=1 Tax=Gnathostoma spinigerum TaxID=75299 RepID=A0ABD6EP63_9BILA
MPLAHIASGSGCSIRPPTTSSASSPSTAIVEAFDHRRTPLRKRDPQPFSLASSSSTVLASPPIRPLSDTLLLALRQRPSTRLFRALFQYIPIRDSPNENPQLELPLQAGDYILVHGEMDEDQFYHGETLDGHTGLVPSNYVERVSEQQLLLNSSRAPSPSFPLIIPSHLTQISHDFTTTSTASQPSSPLPDSVCPYPPVDVSKVTVQEIKEVDAPRGEFDISFLPFNAH